MLTWSQRFRLREWARANMWLIPAVCAAMAFVLASALPAIDRNVDLADPPFVYSSGSAQEVLSAIASGMIAFTGFVFSILLLVVQFGSSAFTPRLLRSFNTNSTIKLALGVFVATFVYALLVLSDVAPGESTFVPQYSVNFSVVLVVASILMFLRLIANVMSLLRVARVVDAIGSRGRREIAAAFGAPATGPEPKRLDPAPSRGPRRLIVNPGRGGVVQALDPRGIAQVALEASATVELVPAVGEFVPHERPIFLVSGELAHGQERRMLDSIAIGEERTLRQDPAFAVRILVDIASKALSPGINDPTTAVQALDHIGDMLFALAGQHMPDGVFRDDAGEIRFLYRTPTWNEFVDLAFTEIRTYGADSPQVADALRSTIRLLRDAVPPWRVGPLDEQARLLEEAVANAGA